MSVNIKKDGELETLVNYNADNALSTTSENAVQNKVVASTVQTLQTTDKNIMGSDAYSAITEYAPDDDTKPAYCIENNSLWKCLVACKNVTPSEDDGTYWQKVTLTQMMTNFQAGVDTIYNTLVDRGATPDSSTPTEIARWINGGWMNDDKTLYCPPYLGPAMCLVFGNTKSTTATTVTAGRIATYGWVATENYTGDGRGYVWMGASGYVRMYLFITSGRYSSTNCTGTLYGVSSSGGDRSTAKARGSVSTTAGNSGVRQTGSWVYESDGTTVAYFPITTGDDVYITLKSSNSSANVWGFAVFMWTKTSPN